MTVDEPLQERHSAAQSVDDETVEILREELLAVHEELTRLTRERALLSGRFVVSGAQMPLGPKATVRTQKRRVRRRLGRVRRDYRAKRMTLRGAGVEIVKTGMDEVASVPVRTLRDALRVLRSPINSRYAGLNPLKDASTSGPVRGPLWTGLLAEEYGDDPAYLRAVRQISTKIGSISASFEATSKLAPRDQKMQFSAVDLNGRFAELAGWLPRIPGPKEPLTPRAQNVILHLVKESRPYLSNGFTSRSHQNFIAEKQADFEPVVLTEPGFPRHVVGEDFESLVYVDQIEHQHIDTGVDYRKVPADRWLEDFAWLAWERVKQIRPAVIHVSSGRRGYETALVALALKEKTGLPVVYEVRSFFEGLWTVDLELQESGEIFHRRMEVETACMQAADHVLTLGEAMRQDIVSRGIPKDKISLVPNGVNLDHFTPMKRDEMLAAQYGVTMPTFGYVSNMDNPREGQEYLVEAAALLKNRGIAAQCVLVGGGPRAEKLKKLAKKRDVSDRVIFTGSIDHDEISAHYALIDVFVVPRIYERAAKYVTPLKPYEAMAMGRPVLVSDLPALTEIVDAPHRGHVFAVEDAHSLTDAIAELLADPAERTRLGQAGRAWIEAERQWNQNGPRYRRVYDEVIGRAQAPVAVAQEGV